MDDLITSLKIFDDTNGTFIRHFFSCRVSVKTLKNEIGCVEGDRTREAVSFVSKLGAERIKSGTKLLKAGLERLRVAPDAETKMLWHLEELARDHRGFELVAQELAEIIRGPRRSGEKRMCRNQVARARELSAKRGIDREAAMVARFLESLPNCGDVERNTLCARPHAVTRIISSFRSRWRRELGIGSTQPQRSRHAIHVVRCW